MTEMFKLRCHWRLDKAFTSIQLLERSYGTEQELAIYWEDIDSGIDELRFSLDDAREMARAILAIQVTT